MSMKKNKKQNKKPGIKQGRVGWAKVRGKGAVMPRLILLCRTLHSTVIHWLRLWVKSSLISVTLIHRRRNGDGQGRFRPPGFSLPGQEPFPGGVYSP